MRWSEEEDRIILDNPELNSQELSKLLNRSQKAIMHRRAKLRSSIKESNEGNNNILITSDWHIPHYDKEMLSLLLNTAQENNTKELIIAGDFLNLDILSTFAKRETPISVDEELGEARGVISTLLSQFSSITVIPGNHERRIISRLQTPLSFSAFFNMITSDERVKTVENDFILLDTKIGTFRICHPGNYSKVKLSVAVQLADLYHQHIIAGHSHNFGFTFSRSGKFLCFDCGGLFDEDKIEYIKDTSTHPSWEQGFIFLKRDASEIKLISPVAHLSLIVGKQHFPSFFSSKGKGEERSVRAQ